jgi:hypothetical protein
MNIRGAIRRWGSCLCFFVAALAARGATVYVWTNSPSEAPPYGDWSTAARSLQTAVNYAESNTGYDVVLATDGLYNVTAQMMVTNTLSIVSVNGPTPTRIKATGSGYRFFNVKAANTLIAGFTLTGANQNGEPDYVYGGGAIGTSQRSCLISNCVITGNFVLHYGAAVNGGTVVNCVIASNTATRAGGGLYDSHARNCLIVGNTGGCENGGGGVNGGVANNCTIVSNTAWRSDTGLQAGGGTYGTIVTNSIIYFNYGTVGFENHSVGSLSFTCTTPLPSGTGNTASDPNFVSAWGNFHLNPGPCIDQGTNLPWMTAATDLEGMSRIINGRVDMGCFEADFASGALVCSFSGTPMMGFDQVQAVFTAAVAGSNTTITTYAWDFGDGQTPQVGPGLAIVTNTYTSVGAYAVTLRVTNSANESASLTYSNYITVVPRTVYVSTNGSAIYPYETWGKAAGGIQAAAVAAQVIGTNRSTIVVSNGTYSVTTPIVIDKGITIRGLNGAAETRVVRTAGSRVFDLKNAGVVLEGFTIRNGNVTDGSYNNAGGGVYCWFPSVLVSNCVLAGNFATHYGGGMAGGTLVNSIVTNNLSARSGGGLNGTIARNCLISHNMGGEGGLAGGGGGMDGGMAESCTIVSNTAWRSDGYGSGGGTRNTTVSNSIVYFNLGANTTVDNWSGGSYVYSCSTPLPSGAGNISANPLFVSFVTRDYHLTGSSPAVNAGTNLPWMSSAFDLDGNMRINQGRVDMGFDETPPAGTVMIVR